MYSMIKSPESGFRPGGNQDLDLNSPSLRLIQNASPSPSDFRQKSDRKSPLRKAKAAVGRNSALTENSKQSSRFNEDAPVRVNKNQGKKSSARKSVSPRQSDQAVVPPQKKPPIPRQSPRPNADLEYYEDDDRIDSFAQPKLPSSRRTEK